MADKDLTLSQDIAAREIARQPDAGFLNGFVAETGFVDPVGTIALLNRLPVSVDILESLSTAASYAADARSDEALDWAFSQPPGNKERAEIISSVAVTLYLNDPESAMKRVEVLPETPDADTYVENAVAILAAEHVDQTKTWIRTEVKGTRKDVAIRSFFSGHQGQTFTSDTVALAGEIRDSGLRMEVMRSCLVRTAGDMPRQELQQELTSAGISDAEVSILLSGQ